MSTMPLPPLNDNSRELWLFTIRFPYGNGESFLESELPELCARFDRVILVPLYTERTQRSVPANARVWPPHEDPFRTASAVDIIRHWAVWFDLVRSIRRSAPSATIFRKHWPVWRSRSRQALRRAIVLHRTLFTRFTPGKVTLYSYWTADQATVLGLLRSMDPRVRFVTRMHGFDLYAERSPDGWPPLREFHLRQAERIHVASEAGLRYLRERYTTHRNLFVLGRLGTPDRGPGPWSASPVLRLVSCANLVPLKRVHLISEALALCGIAVEWTHFGDGVERTKLEGRIAALPPNVHVNLMGSLPNAELLRWYQVNAVDLFVHVSSTEGGVPVSMQEAASFGIPLLACDTGGVNEIVDDHTGTLLPMDAAPEVIAQHLRAHRGSPRDTASFRQGVRARWSSRFNAHDVYGRFAEDLLIFATAHQ